MSRLWFVDMLLGTPQAFGKDALYRFMELRAEIENACSIGHCMSCPHYVEASVILVINLSKLPSQFAPT